MGRGDIDLTSIARRVLEEHGFATEAPTEVPPRADVEGAKDLRSLPWSSIDNLESRDLDQIEFAERLDGDRIRVLVAIADVAAVVQRGSPIDDYAAKNSATIYTGVRTFPMLPEALAFDRTSLLETKERFAVVTEMIVHRDGHLDDMATKVYPARVQNHERLVYE